MRSVYLMTPLAALALFACSPAPVREITPISTSVGGQKMVSDVDVKISPLALDAMMKFEGTARAKRVADGLSPVEAEAEMTTQPARDEYSSLPFQQMLESWSRTRPANGV